MQWTLNKLVTKIQNDLELHAENFATRPEIIAFVNDAVDDAEQLIIDSFSDFYLDYVDYDVVADAEEIPLPADLFDMRIRGLYYDLRGFDNSNSTTSNWYKIKKLPIERFASVYQADSYNYRITNNLADGLRIRIFPNFREVDGAKVRVWYIRQAKRYECDDDLIEVGMKIQYLQSHAKVAIMNKEGDPMLDVELQNLEMQKEKLLSSISRLVDDDEDSYLEMDFNSLDEAYGSQDSGFGGY